MIFDRTAAIWRNLDTTDENLGGLVDAICSKLKINLMHYPYSESVLEPMRQHIKTAQEKLLKKKKDKIMGNFDENLKNVQDRIKSDKREMFEQLKKRQESIMNEYDDHAQEILHELRSRLQEKAKYETEQQLREFWKRNFKTYDVGIKLKLESKTKEMIKETLRKWGKIESKWKKPISEKQSQNQKHIEILNNSTNTPTNTCSELKDNNDACDNNNKTVNVTIAECMKQFKENLDKLKNRILKTDKMDTDMEELGIVINSNEKWLLGKAKEKQQKKKEEMKRDLDSFCSLKSFNERENELKEKQKKISLQYNPINKDKILNQILQYGQFEISTCNIINAINKSIHFQNQGANASAKTSNIHRRARSCCTVDQKKRAPIATVQQRCSRTPKTGQLACNKTQQNITKEEDEKGKETEKRKEKRKKKQQQQTKTEEEMETPQQPETQSPAPKEEKEKEKGKKHKNPWGIIGLDNSNNTCYMNSVIQCLNSIFGAQTVFNQLDYLRNNHNYGLSLSFFTLLGEIFGCNNPSMYLHDQTESFKQALYKMAPQFGDRRQHDCHEFLSCLLYGLHNDLNLSNDNNDDDDETIDISEEYSDNMAAMLIWKMYKNTNDSIIVDLFQAIQKETFICNKCHKETRNFDIFMDLSLSIPNKNNINDEKSNESKEDSPDSEITVIVDVWYQQVKRHAIKLKNNKVTANEVIEILSKKYSCNSKDIAMIVTIKDSHEWFCASNHTIKELLEVTKYRELQCFITGIGLYPDSLSTQAQRKEREKKLTFKGGENPQKNEWFVKLGQLFADTSLQEKANKLYPIFIKMNKLHTCAEVYVVVINCLTAWYGLSFNLEQNNGFFPFWITIPSKQHFFVSMFSTNSNNTLIPSSESLLIGDILFKEYMCIEWCGGNTKPVKAEIEAKIPIAQIPERDLSYTNYLKSNIALTTSSISKNNFKTAESNINKNTNKSHHHTKQMKIVTLQECLDAHVQFTNVHCKDWICNDKGCKNKTAGGKKRVEMWNLPQILIITLKRFELKTRYGNNNKNKNNNKRKSRTYSLRGKRNSYSDNTYKKNNTNIDFPVTGLNLTKYVSVTNKKLLKKFKNGLIYDLKAVAMHSGTIKAGHYTAYGFNEDSKQWYFFNDRKVYLATEKEIKDDGKFAYVLFYKRTT